jgi:hypothetical protein
VKAFVEASKLEGADSPAFQALAATLMSRLSRREQEEVKAKLADVSAKARTARQREAELVNESSIASKGGAEAAKKGR